MLNKKQGLGTLLTMMGIIWLCLNCLGLVQCADSDEDISSNPASFSSECKCSLSMTCTCCQNAVLKAMDLNKTLCMKFKANILKASVDVTVTLDNNELSKFTLDAKTTPTFCVPIISQLTPMAICLRISTKLSGISNLAICPSFYSSFAENQLLAFDFPCLKLGANGISIK